MKNALAGMDNWQVWIDWYSDHLAGKSRGEARELIFASVPQSEWEKGPAAANAWIAAHLPKPGVVSDDIGQRPASFSFRVVDGKIDVAPDDAKSIDAETTRDLYNELKRKAEELNNRLERAQADEKVRAHVARLLAHLGKDYADARPGLLLSSRRSLEGDLRAYDTDEGRRELFPDALSSIDDIVAMIRDLGSTYPKSREIEAEAVAIDLPMDRLNEIEAQSSLIVSAIHESDSVTDAALDAVSETVDAIVYSRTVAERAKQNAYLLLVLGNFGRAAVQNLRSTGARISRGAATAAKVTGREVGGLAGDVWKSIRKGLPRGVEKGAEAAGKAITVAGIAGLIAKIGGPIAALGAVIGSYWPIGKAIDELTDDAPDVSPEPDGEEIETPPAAPRTKPRARKKPSGKKAGK